MDGETVVVTEDGNILAKLPLHNFERIVTFGYTGVSPALMFACVKRNISINFMTSYGKFMGRVIGETYGNVHLRKEQYRISDSEEKSLSIAKNFIISKLYNSKSVLNRAKRDYPQRIDGDKILNATNSIQKQIEDINYVQDTAKLLGYEGKAATYYFLVFEDLILQQKDDFYFVARNKRPPMDNVNALLSFTYSLMTQMCASALECVGLDPYVGFLHQDRSGRMSLALDLLEEFRAVYADRFVLKMINKKIIKNSDFTVKENGAVILTDAARKIYLKHWEEKKTEKITHPFLDEKMEWGMVPYSQALLLARYIRGDLDAYPPFFWK